MSRRPPALLLATRNAKKRAELARLLAGLPLALVAPAELPGLPAVAEEGETYAANARAKAATLARAAGLWTLADDSGLEVDALGGRPGVRSARYAGANAGDGVNLACLLAELSGAPPPRVARFRCHAALAAPDGTIAAEAEGVCEGEIALAPAGAGGFGYDPAFLPRAAGGRTMAELGDAEKDALSHRGAALRALRPRLEALAAACRPRKARS